MKLIIYSEYLFFLGFSIIFLRQPLQYIIGPAYLAALAAGLGLCLSVIIINARKLKLGQKERLLALFFLAIFILHGLLALVDQGPSTRPLWFIGLVQLLAVVLFLHYHQSPKTWQFLKILLTASLSIEFVLGLLQVSYYAIGIGLPPIFDEYEKYSFVSGSFFNANDFSIAVATTAMSLFCLLMFEGKNWRGYIVISLASMFVLISHSRTSFVFMFFFLLIILLLAGKQFILSRHKKNIFTSLTIPILIFLIPVYLLSTDVFIKSTVFEQSIHRLSQLGGVATDESASTRSLVYYRLFDGFQNLWFGTFSDQSYSKYFQNGDFYLMKINPHSFLAEMSFLYGWPGFFVAGGLIGVILINILKNKDLPVSIRWVLSGSLIFFQSVPSSLLAYSNFFLPYIFLIYCRKDFLTREYSTKIT